ALTDLYTLSLHDALPISARGHRARALMPRAGLSVCGAADARHHHQPALLAGGRGVRHRTVPHEVLPALAAAGVRGGLAGDGALRSEEHTSELQSRENLVC